MKAKNLLEAMNGIDDELIEAAEENKKTARFRLPKWAAAAACLVLIIAVGVIVWPKLKPADPGNESRDSRYREGVSVVSLGESSTVWPWEWKTVQEKFPSMVFDGSGYVTRARTVGRELLGEKLGVCDAAGYDIYTEKTYRQSFDVYAIRGVDQKSLVAVDLDGSCVVYRRDSNQIPKDLGEMMHAFSLSENLTLERFCEQEGYQTKGWYLTAASQEIWQILDKCRSAPCRISDGFSPTAKITFTASSEALGTYEKVFSVTKSGQLETNLMEYGYAFNIGTEAAEEIIRLAQKNAKATEMKPYFGSVAGTLTEIGDGYVLIDDSVLCKNKADGIVYRVLTDDIRIRRCLEWEGGFKVGDLVAVQYEGSLDEKNGYTVSGAFSLDKGYLEPTGEVSVQE